MTLILAILVIVLFVLGVALILQGSSETPDPQASVQPQETDRLQQEIAGLQTKQAQMTAQIDQLSMDLSQSQEDLLKARQEAEDAVVLRQENAAWAERLRQAEEKQHLLRSEADRLARESVEALTRLRDQEKALREAAADGPSGEEWARWQKDHQALKDQAAAQTADALRQLKDSEARLQQWQAGDAARIAEQRQTAEGVRQVTGKIREIVAAVAKMKTAYQERLEAMSQAVQAMKDENQLLLAQAQRASQVDDLQQQIAVLRQAAERGDEETAGRLRLLTAEIEPLRLEVETARARIRDLEQGLTAAQEQAAQDQQTIQRSRNEIDALNAEMSRIMEEQLRRESQPPVLPADTVVEKQDARLQEDYENLLREVADYRLKLDFLESAYNAVVEEAEKALSSKGRKAGGS